MRDLREHGSGDPGAHMREVARQIFLRAVAGASIGSGFARAIRCENGVLRVADQRVELKSFSRIFVVSIGKAGHTMAEALQTHVPQELEGIVASSVEAERRLPGFRYFCGGHPMPTAGSMAAAEEILAGLRSLNAASLAIFLLSGGGSSIVEMPCRRQISLDDLIATYRVLVHSGAPIAEINAIRKHLSAVKGGRLARAAGEAKQLSLLVSDVPDHAPDALASGPTMPDSTTVEDCHHIAQKYSMLAEFPAPVRELFAAGELEETPKPSDAAFARSSWHAILSNQAAAEQARLAAQELGFQVELDHGCDDWDYRAAAEYLLERLRGLHRPGRRTCLISGGEVTVRVANGGMGGRNQQFALACAEKIQNQSIAVLSGGTDGIDGNSPAAGAVADGTSWSRAQSAGNDPQAALLHFDAFPVFEMLGDAVFTGPTGNNLRDLRILLAY